jgi:hypothetical protein
MRAGAERARVGRKRRMFVYLILVGIFSGLDVREMVSS